MLSLLIIFSILSLVLFQGQGQGQDVQAPGQDQGPGHSQLPVQVLGPGPQEASLLDAANPGSSSLPPVLPTAPLSSSGDEYYNANSAPSFHGAVGDLRTLGPVKLCKTLLVLLTSMI